MHSKKFALFLPLLATLAIGSWSLSASMAQKTASAVPGADSGQNAGDRLNDRSSDKGFGTNDFLPDADNRSTNQIRPAASKPVIRPTDQPPQGKVMVHVFINTPHNHDQCNTFVAYPYPPKPPKIKQVTKMLVTTAKEGLIKQVLAEGYTSRTGGKYKPFPSQGWRWQYAFNAGLRASGLGFPHVIVEMYDWANDVSKYVAVECKRSNMAETARAARYDDAVKDFDENSVEIEQDAVTQGRFPTEVQFQTFKDGSTTRNGAVVLAPGKWWMTGVHKVSGLKYYWQEPFEIGEDAKGPETVALTEATALVIQGAW